MFAIISSDWYRHVIHRFVGKELARHVRKAQKVLGSKPIATLMKHYHLNHLEAGWTNYPYKHLVALFGEA